MRRTAYSALALAVALSAIGLLTSLVSASPGTYPDGNDSSGFDIKQISHSNDAQSVTYGIDTYESFTNGSILFIAWDFDLDGDGWFDACILMGPDESDRLEAWFAPDCENPTGSAIATRPAGNQLRLQFPMQLLRAGGLGDRDHYEYGVSAVDMNDNEDFAPEGQVAVHTVGPADSPTPSPTPTQSATPSPSPTPTASPTPSPTPTASPSPTPSASPTPTPSATPTASPTPSPTASASASPSPTPTPSSSPSPTPSASPSASPTPTPSPTPSASPSATPSPIPTASPTLTVPTLPPTGLDSTVERVASKLRLVPGEVLRVDGDGFTPGAVLSVVLRSDPINLGSLKADGRGGFNASVKIPANAPAGRHHIVVSGPNPAGGLRTVSFPIELVSRGSRSRAHLPKTGVSIMGLLLVAGALLTAGRLLLATRNELEKRRFG